MAEPLLSVDRVSCRFGGLLAVNAASLAAPAGRITALIGPNGAGKTTLFAIISGFQRPSDGVVRYQGEIITGLPPHELARRGIARTFQLVQPFAGLSVRENILVGAHLRHAKRADALAAADIVGREVGLGDVLDRSAETLTVAGRKRLEAPRYPRRLPSSSRIGTPLVDSQTIWPFLCRLGLINSRNGRLAANAASAACFSSCRWSGRKRS